MTEPVVSRAATRDPWGPRDWLIAGVGLLVLGAILGALANDEPGVARVLFLLIAAPAMAAIAIGVIAKAVQVGIRASRDQP